MFAWIVEEVVLWASTLYLGYIIVTWGGGEYANPLLAVAAALLHAHVDGLRHRGD